MWIPKELKINNFRSIISETLTFTPSKTFLLQGINNTDEGVESNGSGKSSFREALCYALGLPVYAATLSDIINDYSDNVTVTFKAENSVSGGRLSIKRFTPLKGSTKLEIYLNDIDQKDNFSTVPEGDKLIIELIGLPKEDILNHFIISKEKFTSFFSSSDTNKKDLINRFSGANRVDGVFTSIDNDIKKEENNKTDLERKLHTQQGKLLFLEDDLREAVNFNPEAEKNTVLKQLNENLTLYNTELENIFKTIKNDKKKKDELEVSLYPLSSDLDKMDNKIEKMIKSGESLRDKKEKTLSEISEFKSFAREISTSLSGVIACPKCAHEFNPGEEINIEEAREQLPLIDSTIKKLEKSVSDIEIDIQKKRDDVKAKQQSKDKISNEIEDTLDSITEIERDIRLYNREITSKESFIEKTNSEIKRVTAQQIESKEKQIKEKIETVKVEITNFEKEINKVVLKISDLQMWIIRFGKFKSYLANQSLSNIQGLANIYLQQMKSNLGVKIEGFKQNKDGSVREKITPIVLKDGVIRGSGSYKKNSGGERARIDIAITLAMRHLINNSSKTGGFDLFWIDEITEGVDGVGIENIASSINNLSITSLITSHVKHEKNYEHLLTAIKENDETTLKLN